MKVFFYHINEDEMAYMKTANKTHLVLGATEKKLSATTSFLTHGYDCAVITPLDDARAHIIEQLRLNGVRYIVVRGKDYSNVDLTEAGSLGIHVANIPAIVGDSITQVADTIFYNILEWKAGLRPENEVTPEIHFISAGGNKK